MGFITTKHVAGDGDFSWLGSAHGIWNGRTVTIDVAKFTKSTDYPNGYVPAGTPVTVTNGIASRYDGSKLGGFIRSDVEIATGDVHVEAPLLDHGRIVTANVPFAGFTAPATQENTQFVFI